MIVVIDYGMGNLHSVRKALEVVGARTKVSARAEEISKADKIVFPGVGSFGEAMKELNKRKLVKPIKDAISAGTPFLGLCLGLQLLFERSEESPGVKGLSVLEGAVKKFNFSQYPIRNTQYPLKVPHMGWNNIVQNTACGAGGRKMLKGVPAGSYMYFVHSYYVDPKDRKVILTRTNYGTDFASGVCRDNVYALQFHPEKSQALGLRMLKNFVKL